MKFVLKKKKKIALKTKTNLHSVHQKTSKGKKKKNEKKRNEQRYLYSLKKKKKIVLRNLKLQT